MDSYANKIQRVLRIRNKIAKVTCQSDRERRSNRMAIDCCENRERHVTHCEKQSVEGLHEFCVLFGSFLSKALEQLEISAA